MFPQVIPYFYKIPMGKRSGEDVSALEGELKEKLAKLNEASQYLPVRLKAKNTCIITFFWLQNQIILKICASIDTLN